MKFEVGKKSGVGRKLAISILVLFLVLTGFSMYSLPSSKSWPMFRNDISHTANSTSIAPNTNDTLWVINLTDPLLGRAHYGIVSSPAIANGKVFIGGEWSKKIFCIDENGNGDGTTDIIWYFDAGGDVYSSPTVSNGIVYCGSGGEDWPNNKLFAIPENDPNGDGVIDSSEEIWNFTANYNVECSPMVKNGKVFFGEGSYGLSGSGIHSEVYCLDALTGTKIWNFTAPDVVCSTPAIFNNMIIFGCGDNKIYALPEDDPNGDGIIDDSEVIWTYTTDGRVVSSPTVVDNKVYVGSGMSGGSNKFYCLDALSGALIWVFTATGSIEGSPAIAYNKVYFACEGFSAKVYALPLIDPNGDGTIDANEIIWNYTTTSFGIISSPAVADNKLFIGSDTGGLFYCLNAQTGALIWSKNIGTRGPGWVYSSPAVANGKVFIGSGSDEYLYCFGVGGPPLEIDYIVIEDDAHNELTTVDLNISGSVTAFAAGYNGTTSTFVRYVKVNWAESGGLGSLDPPKGSSTIYTAGTTLGITTITGENVTMGWNDDFIIEIICSTTLNQGWNLISIPLIQKDKNLTKVLESIDGLYDAVQWHDNTDTNDPWKHYKEGKPFGNDLSEINETMGFWIHITQPGDTIFHYNGTQPTENQSIALRKGWNLVGYPSLTNYNRTTALNNITFGMDVDAIWNYDAATQGWMELGESDYFQVGRGYWVYSKVEKTWEVPL